MLLLLLLNDNNQHSDFWFDPSGPPYFIDLARFVPISCCWLFYLVMIDHLTDRLMIYWSVSVGGLVRLTAANQKREHMTSSARCCALCAGVVPPSSGIWPPLPCRHSPLMSPWGRLAQIWRNWDIELKRMGWTPRTVRCQCRISGFIFITFLKSSVWLVVMGDWVQTDEEVN